MKITLLVSCSFLITGSAVGQQVGINTDGSAPTMMLHVKVASGNDGIRIDNASGTGDAMINLQDGGVNRWTFGNDASDANRFKIDDGGAIGTDPFFVIEDAGADGNIGININNPAYELHVQGVDNADYIVWVENTGTGGAGLIAYNNTGTTSTLAGGVNVNNGLGVYGVILPATVNGGTAVYGTGNDSDIYGVFGDIPTTGSWLGFGGVFIGGLGYVNGVYNLSDERVKKNVRTIESPTEILRNIDGVLYEYNEEYGYTVNYDSKTYSGFLAQNVKEHYPYAVAMKRLPVNGPDEAGLTMNMAEQEFESFQVVDYTALVPVLVEAFKEQQKTIEELEARIQELENK